MYYNAEWDEPTSGVCTECGAVFSQTRHDEVCSECKPLQKPRNPKYKPFRMYARITKGMK